MYPRGMPDLGWLDLLAGLYACLVPGDPDAWASRATQAFSSETECLACLSVRSGLDLLCRAMAWPPGSEVLVSAITLDDMATILRNHKLVPVPVDVDPRTLAVDGRELQRQITPRTKAILVAHLFGSRMPLDEIVHTAKRFDLMLLEDCAQAVAADAYLGHPGSDVSLFSFGPIKTKTALGGAILRFRDQELRQRVESIQYTEPVVKRLEFMRRVAVFSLLKVLSVRLVFSVFIWACALLGIDYDRFIQNSVRGFGGGELLARIRRRPPACMLRLLARRLQSNNFESIERRIDFARRIVSGLPEALTVGASAAHHTHWVLPVRSPAPERLIADLRSAGFDSTRGASRLCAVASTSEGRPPPAASSLLNEIVYLPMWPAMPEHSRKKMVQIVSRHGGALRPKWGQAGTSAEAAHEPMRLECGVISASVNRPEQTERIDGLRIDTTSDSSESDAVGGRNRPRADENRTAPQ
jgi:dTDP-4-amino-4,6-dideoxygalactose transaminase